MKGRFLRYLQAAAGAVLFFAAPTAAPAAAAAPLLEGPAVKMDLFSKRAAFITEWKYQSGDRPEWAGAEFDDGSWERTSPDRVPYAGVSWVRASLVLSGNIDDADVLALVFEYWPPAFEVYWDGALVGRHGTIDAQGKFQSGKPRLKILRLGRERTLPGKHVLALRLAFKRRPASPCCFGVTVGYHAVLNASLENTIDSSRMDIGLYLAAVLFSLFFYLGGWKSPSLLFFAGYALFPLLHNLWSISDLSGAAFMPMAFFSPSIAANVKLVSFLLLIFFLLWHLEIPRKAFHLIVPTLTVLVVNLAGLTSGRPLFFAEAFLLAYGLGLCVSRLRTKTAGAGFALAGVAAPLTFLVAELSGLMGVICRSSPSIPWPLVFTGFSLACLLGSISFKIRDRSRKLQALEIRSQRLETELLKKSIQPHFIMNTLFSIKSLTAKDPPKAERLIEALAEEFQIISRIAAEKEIGFEEEIDLCRSHLQLMGHRRDASYSLVVEGACPGEKIPPMVFHTLIENGLTHSYLPKENGTFRLACERTDKGIVYRLRNDGTRIPRIAGLSEDKVEEGMGLKYVKARLEESHPGRWRLNYGVREGFWEVEIALLPKA